MARRAGRGVIILLEIGTDVRPAGQAFIYLCLWLQNVDCDCNVG